MDEGTVVRAQIYKRTAQYVIVASKGPKGNERTEQERSTRTKQLAETTVFNLVAAEDSVSNGPKRDYFDKYLLMLRI